MKHWIAGTAGVIALVMTAGIAQAQGSYRDWDRDDDGKLSQNEFHDGFGSRGVYDGWGSERRMDRERFDQDRDNVLGMEDDRSEMWSQENAFDTWDRNKDGYVDDREYSENVYRYYDKNQDDNIDEDEFNRMDVNLYK